MNIEITSEFIKLDSFLKWAGVVSLGSEAKAYILEGVVKVNDKVATQRGKKLYPGDKVEFNGDIFHVVKGE